MAKKNEIEVLITGEINGLRKSLNEATAKVSRFGTDFKASMSTFGGQRLTAISTGFAAIGTAAAAAVAGGLYLFTSSMSAAIDKASEFSTASYLMGSSLEAANRQFSIGTAAEWEDRIKSLSNTLKVYSETDLRNAASKTIDMTKRLGMSAVQMEKVIQVSGDLAAGKTSLVDGVERVTAALRGEAEASEMLGLTLNEDYVKGWYAAHGASSTAWKDLTDIEKAQVRYNILLEQASPKLGQAAEALGIYSGQLQATKNSFGDLQKEVGGLVTQNTFVIESLKILGEMFKGLQTEIAGNREKYVSLVKDGVLLFIDGISASIEVMRGFYNGWQGLSLAAHGAVIVIVKGMEIATEAIRVVLKPLDLLLTGLAKIGVIDSNPLQDLEETLKGFGKFSVDEFNAMLDKVSDTNAKFDEGKRIVEEFKAKIKDIPAEYKQASNSMSDDTKEVSKEIKLVDGVWVEVYDAATEASNNSTDKQLANIRKISKAIESMPSASGAGGGGGYARGGDPFSGGLRGYGGGDRRLILVEDGEHVIRKEAVARLGHGFFQRFNSLNFPRLPKFATGGAVAPAAATATSAAPITINLNYSGSGTMADAKRMAGMVMAEMQRQYRRASA